MTAAFDEAGMNFLSALDWRRPLLIVGTLLAAFASGHFMQNGLPVGRELAITSDAPDAGPIIERSDEIPELPVPPAATLIPMGLEPAPSGNGIADDSPLPNIPRDEATGRQVVDPCIATAVAEPLIGGRVLISLEASCVAGKQVEIRQDMISVSYQLDTEGRAVIEMPALDTQPRIAIHWPDGRSSEVDAEVPDAFEYHRAALIFEGDPLLFLHALEFGATRGRSGHVHTLSPMTIDQSMRGVGGYLSVLGDGTGQTAEIYTFPKAGSLKKGAVRIIAEGAVSKESCGQNVTAVALQTDPLGGMISSKVSIAMPGCDRIGDIISLKNVFRDLRLAQH